MADRRAAGEMRRIGAWIEPMLAAVFYAAVLAVVLWAKGFDPATSLFGYGLAFADWSGHFHQPAVYSRMITGVDPLFTTRLLFYPGGVNLLPLQGNTLIALSSGVAALVVSLDRVHLLRALFVLLGNGVGLFVLVRTATKSGVGALIAGTLGMLCGYATWGINSGNTDFAGWLWICLHLAFLWQTVDRPGLRDTILAALFGALAVSSNLSAGLHLPLLDTVLIAFRAREIARPAVRRLVAVLVLTAVFLAPLGVAFVRAGRALSHEGKGAVKYGKAESTVETPAPPDVLTDASHAPNEYAPWSRSDRSRGRPDTYFVAWILAALGVLFGARRALPWFAACLVFLLLSLGPYLLWINAAGDATRVLAAPLPFLWLWKWIPFYDRLQFPGRLFAYAAIAGGVLVGFGAFEVLRVVRERTSGRVASAVALALLALAVVEPGCRNRLLVIDPPPVNPYYGSLAGERGTGALIDVPFNFANLDATYLYFQTRHGRPVFGGMFAPYFNADPTRGLMTGNALIESVVHLQAPLFDPFVPFPGPRSAMVPPPDGPEQTIDEACRELASLGYEHLVLHRRTEWENGVLRVPDEHPLARFLAAQLGPPVYADEELVVYDLRERSGEGEPAQTSADRSDQTQERLPQPRLEKEEQDGLRQ